MSTKRKRQARQARQARPPVATGSSSPPIKVASATVAIALGDDIEIGPCVHQMQCLPNGQTLLLFSTDDEIHTYLLGEEAFGLRVKPIRPDAPAEEEADAS